MALDALRVEGVVHGVLGEHDVYDVVADVPLALQLPIVKILFSRYSLFGALV